MSMHDSTRLPVTRPHITVAEIQILQDAQGLYHLNTLHKASEKATKKSKSPNEWLRLKSTQELIEETRQTSQTGNSRSAMVTMESVCRVQNGGTDPGVYAHELLAVSYAGWISPAFQLKVNQAFIDSRKPQMLPMAMDEIVAYMAQQHVEQRRRMEAVEAKVEQVAQGLTHLLEQEPRFTIEEYIISKRLRAKMPESLWPLYGRHLNAYCAQHGLQVELIPVHGKRWDTEGGYPASVFEATLTPWLFAINGQAQL